MGVFLAADVKDIDRFSKKLLIGMAITFTGKLIGCDLALPRALGYTSDEMLGRKVSDFVSSDHRHTLMERIHDHNTSWYSLDLMTKDRAIIPARVIPEEMILEGRTVRTSVLLHRGPIEDTESHLINALKDTITALSKAIESRDPYTAGHQARTAMIATMIGRELTLDNSSLLEIEMAAHVHDIGKISIPSEILVKPGHLTDGEWIMMKSHPVIGEKIIGNTNCSPNVKSMVRSHHERLDGSGYPDGLSKDQLSIGIRILGVADAMDAIAGIRPYHTRRTMADALEILESGRGVYDGEVVSAASSLYRQGLLLDREYTGFVEE